VGGISDQSKGMKILIVGAGRMGMRHAEGALLNGNISEISLTDISEKSLDFAAKTFGSRKNNKVFRFIKSGLSKDLSIDHEIVIISSTAEDRLNTIRSVLGKNTKYLLLEKPLGQSLKEVEDIVDFLKLKHPHIKSYVNLSKRLSPSVIELKKDLNSLPQFSGHKTITLNTGALGIGANGIHYLDLFFYLLNGEQAKLECAEIEDSTIQSGRGPQFADFGGWAVIKFYDCNDQYTGKALISITSDSSLAGAIEIVGAHGRILFDEIRETRIDTLRNVESKFPIHRYHADYMPDKVYHLKDLSIPELTSQWIDDIAQGNERLPNLRESIKAHRLMFEWLSYSKKFKEKFPIT
jgi:predicted dehydrogenase